MLLLRLQANTGEVLGDAECAPTWYHEKIVGVSHAVDVCFLHNFE